MAKKTNLKLNRSQRGLPSASPIDAVRNPNFDAALAQQDYLNNLAQSLANYQAQTYPSGATKQLSDLEARNFTEQNAMGQQRDPNKEIILNFAGGQFGIPNDEAANAIAKKYNLDIVRKPETGSGVPNYLLRSNGDINSIISQIKNEQGIGYVEPNSMMSTGFGDTTKRNIPITASPQGPQVGSGLGGQQPINPMVGYGSQQPGNMPVPNMPSLMPIPQGQQGAMASQYTNPAMNQMADYNKMLQQGMQRNQDMNQAAQNLVAPAGPQKSFSQVAGGMNRMNRMPRKPRPNAISPSNQKLI